MNIVILSYLFNKQAQSLKSCYFQADFRRAQQRHTEADSIARKFNGNASGVNTGEAQGNKLQSHTWNNQDFKAKGKAFSPL